ncbi:HNH endonuclease signature motif containing protein, partial [Pantoea sp.]|uniref:HNH endonuclease signature motif containing protein n=1 Tax=Pantoea sp. TaxID=69393 RepID=UPI0028A5AA77
TPLFMPLQNYQNHNLLACWLNPGDKNMKPSLTQERLKEILYYDENSGLFTWMVNSSSRRKGDVAGYLDSKGYISIRISGKHYRAHRLAWLYMYGAWPTYVIDHINRVKSDNRAMNLRDVTSRANSANRSDNSSGCTGVSWRQDCDKWRASIWVDGKMKHLGNYHTIDAAHAAYRRALNSMRATDE